MSIDELWTELVTTALLGTDRRDPPALDGPIGDLVADTVRAEPSSRMLALVAACTAVRRAGVRPAQPVAPLSAPPADDRPPCTPAAVDRWHHVTTSWPVLEDEWMLASIDGGWRLAPELAVPALQRHRRDPVRLARVLVGVGPLATWLIEQIPDLAPHAPLRPVDAEALAELPDLPVPPELVHLLHESGAAVGGVLAVGLEDGSFGQAHRAVLVNVLARCAPDGLADVADVLEAVDSRSSGHGLASVLADLATTRRRMLDELAPGDLRERPSGDLP